MWLFSVSEGRFAIDDGLTADDRDTLTDTVELTTTTVEQTTEMMVRTSSSARGAQKMPSSSSRTKTTTTLFLLSFSAYGSNAKNFFVSDDHHFRDAYNRVMIFHGFNDVGEAKGSGETPGGPQYQPKRVMDPSVQTQLQEWGFNAMRLPMMWSGVAVADGVYDQDYLDTMKTVVGQLNDLGISSLLDMHQDVLSSLTGSYDGAPVWLVNQTVPRHDYPWPLTEPLHAWGLGYVTEATSQSFQEIYDNTHGGLDAWGAVWNKIAENFKDVDGVLGYELLNEPWAGDIYTDPTLMFPGNAGSKNLQPSYTSVAEAIREVDDNSIIFYEPVTWGMVFPGDGSGHNVTSNHWASSGFTQVPGGDDYKNRSVFSYHYYCWVAEKTNDPLPTFIKAICDEVFGPKVFETVLDDISKLGGGSMLTEVKHLI